VPIAISLDEPPGLAGACVSQVARDEALLQLWVMLESIIGTVWSETDFS
jgi:hypothetical protein